MPRTRVKICGIGHVEDAIAAANSGADAIGLVFVPTVRRNVSVDRAAEILAALPPFVTPVGLFVDSSTARIREITGQLHLRHIQMHGDESPEQIAELRDFVIIKAVHVDAFSFFAKLKSWRDAIVSMNLTNIHGLLLDTASKTQAGGTGQENNWELIRQHQAAGDFAGLPPLIAAGGLNPTNVAGVIQALQPWAVDVSSGVEESAGKKSHSKIENFISAVRSSQ